MSYTVQELAPGDIILVRGHACIDRGIAWATVNAYTHAVIVGNGVLIQGMWPTVDTVALDSYCVEGDRFVVAGPTPAARDRVVAHAEARIGQRYGWEEMLLDAGRDILHVPWIKRLGWMNRHVTCSGLVANAYAAVGYPVTYALFPSPADLSYSPRLFGARYWH